MEGENAINNQRPVQIWEASSVVWEDAVSDKSVSGISEAEPEPSSGEQAPDKSVISVEPQPEAQEGQPEVHEDQSEAGEDQTVAQEETPPCEAEDGDRDEASTDAGAASSRGGDEGEPPAAPSVPSTPKRVPAGDLEGGVAKEDGADGADLSPSKKMRCL